MALYPFLVEEIIALTKLAGQKIMGIYAQDFAVYEKSDLSPVTDADILAEKIIFAGLQGLTPDIAIVGEEHAARGEVPALRGRYFWLVDPIDGTKEFVKKNGEFTVNISLIDEDTPIFGIVYAPALNELYFTQSPTQAFAVTDNKTTLLKTRPIPREGYSIVTSRSHFNPEEAYDLIGTRPIFEVQHLGSSLKFCAIANGKADFYPCTHTTSEWDTGAGHAIVKAAGGIVVDASFNTLTYRKKDLKNPQIMCFGDPCSLKR